MPLSLQPSLSLLHFQDIFHTHSTCVRVREYERVSGTATAM